MGDAFTTSLVEKTNPNPYHQLIVLSQYMINNAFFNMWAISDPASPIRSCDMKIRGGGSLKGDLAAPMISLNVTSLDPQLYYLLCFQSGKLDLYVSEDPDDDTMKHWDVSKWVLAFPVSIAQKILDPNDPNYKGYLQAMGNPGGVFSLAQLLIDSSQAIAWDESMSSFNGEDWSKENAVIQSNFAALIDRWLGLMKKEGKTLLGIALQTSDPTTVNPDASSFPPTSLNYYMYPWLDPAVNNPVAKNLLDENAFCYLMMTSNVTAPNPAVLQYSGTFVDATSNHGGTLVMNSAQFWNQWLLPLITFLNMASEIQCTTPIAEAYGNGVVKVAPRFTMSFNPDHTSSNDSYFQFEPAGDGGGWTWVGDKSTSYNSDEARVGIVLMNKIEVWEDAQASSRLTFAAGGQKISITGTNTFNFTCKQYGVESGPFKTESTFSITLDWHINLGLGVVGDGGLQIARISDPPGTDAITVTGRSSSEGLDWNTPWSEYEEHIRQGMDDFFQSQLSNVENTLIDGLAHQHKLFLPASGTFLMEDAEFNARGDLIAFLHYNGAPPPGKTVEPPAYLGALPPRKERNAPRVIPSKPKPIDLPAGRIEPENHVNPPHDLDVNSKA
jgi:hypothetical protein